MEKNIPIRHPLRLGYKASAEQFNPNLLLDFAVAAEENGFDSVFISDHFQPWRHSDGHAPFAFSWLAAAGERTQRVKLGTSVCTPTFRYHPGVVAQAFGTLGVLYPDRMILGVGSGEHLNEGVLGSPWPPQGERFARLREAVKLIRRLMYEEGVTFSGDYYRINNATIYDRPERPIPIYIAASGPQTASFAGQAGDGFICTSGKGMELYRDKLLPAVARGEEKASKSPGAVDRMIEMKVSFDPNRERALEDTKIWAALALSPEQKANINDPREMEREASKVADIAPRRWLVASDPEEHIAQIKPYLELGFRHLVFHAPGNDQKRFLTLYGQQILPRLREVASGIV